MGRVWAGRVIGGIASLLMLFDAVLKFAKPAPVIQGFVRSGWPADLSAPVGAILLICTVLYMVPRTSVLGAILLTGYLGGAVATNLRLESPLFTNTLLPVYIGVLFWVSLLLRVPQIGDFFPFLKSKR